MWKRFSIYPFWCFQREWNNQFWIFPICRSPVMYLPIGFHILSLYFSHEDEGCGTSCDNYATMCTYIERLGAFWMLIYPSFFSVKFKTSMSLWWVSRIPLSVHLRSPLPVLFISTFCFRLTEWRVMLLCVRITAFNLCLTALPKHKKHKPFHNLRLF